MLPPFIHDTLAWLRRETALPGGAASITADETPSTTNPGAYAAPFAAAVAGAIAAGALILFWVLGLPSLAVAVATSASIAAIGAARVESGVVRAGDKRAGSAGAGTAALLFLLLVEIAAIDGLVTLHAPSAAIALIAALVMGLAASIAFRLTQPARPVTEIGETRPSHGGALQGLTLVTIVVATALLLPVFRIGPTAAGLVAALAAFVIVIALTKEQSEADVHDNSLAAGKAAEAAALLAILAFSHTT